MKNIKPVISYYGSKYRMLKNIFSVLNLNSSDIFLDLFAGSGIVGVNAKHLFNCQTIINDYDNVLPLNLTYALKNILSFEGNLKNYTKKRLDYFIKRLDNGWVNKLNQYNKILQTIDITHFDYKQILKNIINNKNKITKLYADPPYFNKTGMYKNSFTIQDHIDLYNLLSELKVKTKIVISYNDEPFIKELYKDWNIIEINKTNVCGINKNSSKVKELLITNI
ncbi:DNA adenine methylase [Mycoplasma mycoides]|uniref:DNA adenine methylase n=1 Tax=Mycoplasma mycoides TaxID=2102 RepID=UPI00223F34D9|nr:DNA adenine methylase [Mycoplasma mycoides]QVJ96009.1 DNA adenine methylase [Mycoplasma mycoides subsp. capri]QVJ96903.1 DNA adenine methylase [Mycoplasma mycoides subsp. capri]QVK00766.1 DNA adenine methylase [Mycoplasma mycoides subsp. capri]